MLDKHHLDYFNLGKKKKMRNFGEGWTKNLTLRVKQF